MGSGGGGDSTTSAQHSPEMRQLQQAALPEIRSMLQLNPLSSYAAWSPRQIAGSNPAYDMLFAQANRMQPALSGLDLIFGGGGGQPQGGGNPLAVPNVDSMNGSGSPMGGQGDLVAPPPPNYQPLNVQDIIQQQIASQVAPVIEEIRQANAGVTGPIGGQYYSGGAAMPGGRIVWQGQEGGGFPRIMLENGQMYTDYGQGWVNG